MPKKNINHEKSNSAKQAYQSSACLPDVLEPGDLVYEDEGA